MTGGAGELLLVGMSVREVTERDRLTALADRLDGGTCFLQVGDPSLSRALTGAADRGAPRVVLLGVSFGALAPASSWLRRIAGHWWRERSGHRPEVAVATTLLRHEADLERDPLALTRPIHGAEAPLESAAWESVPSHDRQVLVCRGPRCTAHGSDATAETLARELRERGLGDDDVLVTQTGCQFPCNHAPVASVQPDDVWYGRLGPDVVGRLVTEHLLGGEPVADHRLPRTTTRSRSR
jgi:(2Fe-2S) ferredoxin